jgi:predicted RNA-binding Zn-ribbon protein involved in translation (DUF1610 family)
MLVKSTCQSCGGHLEFEAEHVGTQIECPHCQQPTLLRSAGLRPGTRGKQTRTKTRWLVIAAWLIGIVVIIGLCVLIVHLGLATPTDIATGAGSIGGIIAVCILGGLALCLAIFWLIFPWMVYNLLKRILTVLEKIQSQTKP